ncbi:hypothetical protein HYH03_001401 [Edaphochlamys debaryana]|uniref:Uridine kinase n=1 Tax=Edaphochlamys debaryana TaxID=47281 RepID=A0A836C677_9CHLO|nr:hypothetical protein HYH03_001401 [Edaphochlamys debaryana]|eukprot:KAG2500634.1 hypothetical protein HYH03_001401 [Edaphochlamys debaryana]
MTPVKPAFDAANGRAATVLAEASTSGADGALGPSPSLKGTSSSGGVWAPGSGRRRQHEGACFLIGVAGGTASGKTTVVDRIMQRLQDSCVVMLSQDSFYRALTDQERATVDTYNFDHPDAFDTPLLVETLRQLRTGSAAEVPVYDFCTHARTTETRLVGPADVVVVEGILVLALQAVREMLHMKVYVDTDDDLRLARRITRDTKERGRDVAGVLKQYSEFVKPMFDQYVAPSRRHADVIIPWGKGDNSVAIDLITEHIRTKLQQPELKRIYANLELIPSNFQIQGMHTIIRDRNTSKEDFVFYADRLNRLVVEAGLGLLPFTEAAVTTPTGHQYNGVAFARQLCGVSIIRSGEAMEAALRACCKGIKIGKILVQRHTDHNDVIYEKLPTDIAERHVLLLDPMLTTGNTAVKAIQILKDKGVPEDRILFLTLMAAPEGIHKVCGTYPAVRLITSEVDDAVDAEYNLVPGVGNYGNRYFCE